MTITEWVGAVFGVVLQTTAATAYIHNKFSSKADLKLASDTLKEVTSANQGAIIAKLEHLHECVHELKGIIHEQMEWKK